MARIGIFGGSFNPIHSGHLRIANQALTDWALDFVYVIPARESPFKIGVSGTDALGGFTSEERMELVRAACASSSRLIPCDIESKRSGVSYSIDTVREIAKRHPGAELYFIVGEDSVAGLPRWKDWPLLEKLCKFVPYPRTAESSTEIRRRRSAGEDFSDLVPAMVFDGIARMRKTKRKTL